MVILSPKPFLECWSDDYKPENAHKWPPFRKVHLKCKFWRIFCRIQRGIDTEERRPINNESECFCKHFKTYLIRRFWQADKSLYLHSTKMDALKSLKTIIAHTKINFLDLRKNFFSRETVPFIKLRKTPRATCPLTVETDCVGGSREGGGG